jgi:glyoxylate reductase
MPNKPKIFVTRRVIGLEDYMDRLDLDVWEGQMPPSPQELRERTRGCIALISLLTDKLDADFFDSMPDLKIVSQIAVGVNNIDLAAAKARGIPVGHTPGVLTEATADMAFALLLAVARNIVPGEAYIRAAKWKTWEPALLLGQAVYGATLGIIGFGRIGKAVAERARGFKMNILVTAPRLSQVDAEREGVHVVALDELLSESDFVSLHTPLKPDTHHMIGVRELALMKPTATLVNTARGEVIDPAALYDALKAGRPGAAALDVTEPEPLPADHPLLTLPNCLIVPHLGSATFQTRLAMTRMAMANLEAALRGEPMLHRANP